MVIGVGFDHAGGGRTPAVTCKRIADSRPVVVVSDADVEVPRWRPQAGRNGTTSEISTGLHASMGSTRSEDTSSCTSRRQTVLGSRSPPQSVGPTPKLTDVTQCIVNLDIKVDDQELQKLVHERQCVPDGGSFRFPNENQPNIEQDIQLQRQSAQHDGFPAKPGAFGRNAVAERSVQRSVEEMSETESHPVPTSKQVEESGHKATVASSLVAVRFTQTREVPQPKASQVPHTSLGAAAAAAAASRTGKTRAKQRPSKSPGSLVRSSGITESRQQLASPRPLSVRGLGDKRTGPVVADHRLGEDALRQSQETRRETLAQKIAFVGTSLKERAEAITMTETERAFSTMNVNRRRPDQTNSNKQNAHDVREVRSQVTEDLLLEVGRMESTSQLATSEIEPARACDSSDTANGLVGDTMQENRIILDSVASTACQGEDDDTKSISSPARALSSREPLGEMTRSSTDNLSKSLNAESLKSSIDNLTQQMRGIVRQWTATNEGPKTKTATSVELNPAPKTMSPPRLTASLAKAVHSELERLVIGAPVESSEDAIGRSSDGTVTLNTTSTEISASTREAAERLPSNALEGTSSVTPQVDRSSRGQITAPKRAARQALARSPYAEQSTRSPARQQRAPRDNGDERRKRLGTTGIVRPEGKLLTNISTLGGLSQGVGAEPIDGSLCFKETDEVVKDPLASNEFAVNAIISEEPKKKRPNGWYSQERARELISEKEREAAEKRKSEEEREKRRHEQLRRLESAYKARIGCGPTGGSKSAPPKASSTANTGAHQNNPEQKHKQPPPPSASSGSVAEGSRPQSRGTSVCSFRPPQRKAKGVQARVAPKRRPTSAGATSRRRRNEAFDDMTKQNENENPRISTHAAHHSRRSQQKHVEGMANAALGSLSDGGESSEGSRRVQEPRLATKIRNATRRRAQELLLRGAQNQLHTSLVGEAWADSYEPSTDSHTVSLQGDRRDANGDFGFQYMWPNEPTRQPSDRIIEDHGWGALDPTQWPTRHARVTDPPNRAPSSDGSNPPSPGWNLDHSFMDFIGDSRSQRPSSYLTADHRRIVDEVLAEQRWWRRVASDRSPASSFSHPEVQGMRPPSRGGESCQPLGPTTPPSYENDLPETYTQYQPLIRSLERPASPYADITDDDDESVTGNQDLSSSHNHVESIVNHLGAFHGGIHSSPASVTLPVSQSASPGSERPEGVVGGTAVPDTIDIEETGQLASYGNNSPIGNQSAAIHRGVYPLSPPAVSSSVIPGHENSEGGSGGTASPDTSEVFGSPSEEQHSPEDQHCFARGWASAQLSPGDCPPPIVPSTQQHPESPCGTSNKSGSEDLADLAMHSVSCESEEAEVAEGERVFQVDEWQVVQRPSDVETNEDLASSTHDVDVITEAVCSISQAIEEKPVKALGVDVVPVEAVSVPSVGGDEIADTEAQPVVPVTQQDEVERCANCGTIFHKESNYCMNCGAKRPKEGVSAKSGIPQTETDAPRHLQTGAIAKAAITAKDKQQEKAKVAEAVATALFDELLEDSVQVAHSARSEPALRHPTPNAAIYVSAITDLCTEDSPESDSAESERKTPPASRRTPPENLAEDAEAIAKAAAQKAHNEAVKAEELANTAVTAEQAEAASLAARNASQFAQQAQAAAAKAHALVEAARSRMCQQPPKASAVIIPVTTTPTKTTSAVKPTLAGEESPSDAKSLSSSSSSSDSSLGRELIARTSAGVVNSKDKDKKDARVPFASLSSSDSDSSKKTTSSPKEPPRPPSPPPDMRSAAATGSGDASNEYRGFRSRDEVADLVTGDLMQMLLSEVWQDIQPSDTPSPRRSRRGHSEDIRGSKAIGVGDRSPPKRHASLSAKSKLSDEHKSEEDTKDIDAKSSKDGSQGIDTSECFVAPFFASVMSALAVTDEETPVQIPVASVETWLPSVLEVMRAREGVTKPMELIEVGEGVPRAAEASLVEVPISPSAASRQSSHEHDIESWTRLLADALVEIAGEEVKAEPRVLGWRRPGYGEPPLSRFKALQAAEGKAAREQQTWKNVKGKLEEATRFACKSDSLGDLTSGSPISGGHDDLQNGNIDEKIDQLIEEGIAADEASWLDIRSDVLQVKNQVVQMIFSDLVEETAAEIQKLWPEDTGQLYSPG